MELRSTRLGESRMVLLPQDQGSGERMLAQARAFTLDRSGAPRDMRQLCASIAAWCARRLEPRGGYEVDYDGDAVVGCGTATSAGCLRTAATRWSHGFASRRWNAAYASASSGSASSAFP
jgi:hypothetical protein